MNGGVREWEVADTDGKKIKNTFIYRRNIERIWQMKCQ